MWQPGSIQPAVPFMVTVDHRSSRANLHKSCVTTSESCERGQWQTLNHNIHTRPITKFDGSLLRLHTAGDGAINWMKTTANKALAK